MRFETITSDKLQQLFVIVAKKCCESIVEPTCKQNKKKVKIQCDDTQIHDINELSSGPSIGLQQKTCFHGYT